MKENLQFVISIFCLTISAVSCGSSKIDLKKKEKEIQAFLDSTRYLKLDVEVRNSRDNKKGIIVFLNGTGATHNEIYEPEAKEYLASFLTYKFFGDEIIPKDVSLVFQYTHVGSPQDVSWYEFKESVRNEAINYYDRNPCFYKQMEYLIREGDPEEYMIYLVCMERTDEELQEIKPSYRPKGLNFFETLYGASQYSCSLTDSIPEDSIAIKIDNSEVLRILLLEKFISQSKDTTGTGHLNQTLRIANIKNRFRLVDLLMTFILVDSLGTLKNYQPIQ